MKKKNYLRELYPVKIENRGKCSQEELAFTEELLNYICNKLDKGLFMKIEPKMFYVLKKTEVEEDELGGFEFTINSSFYKGRIEIRQNVELDYNIYFYKRLNRKGKIQHELYKTIKDVPEEELNKQFQFLRVENDFSDICLKKGDVVLLDNGFIGIVVKYYSNEQIGIIYDEDEKEPEEYISKNRIIKKIR